MGKRGRGPRRTRHRGFHSEDPLEFEPSFELDGRFREFDEFDIYSDDEWEEELHERRPTRGLRSRLARRWRPSVDDDGYLERGA